MTKFQEELLKEIKLAEEKLKALREEFDRMDSVGLNYKPSIIKDIRDTAEDLEILLKIRDKGLFIL